MLKNRIDILKHKLDNTDWPTKLKKDRILNTIVKPYDLYIKYNSLKIFDFLSFTLIESDVDPDEGLYTKEDEFIYINQVFKDELGLGYLDKNLPQIYPLYTGSILNSKSILKFLKEREFQKIHQLYMDNFGSPARDFFTPYGNKLVFEPDLENRFLFNIDGQRISLIL